MAEGHAREGVRCTWSAPETRLLISVWSEDAILLQLESARNKVAYIKIMERLTAAGYNRTLEQIKRKVRDLRMAHRKVRDNNSRSGRGRVTCPFYEELDVFLGGREAIDPQSLLESQDHRESSPEIDHEPEDSEEEEEEEENNDGGDESSSSGLDTPSRDSSTKKTQPGLDTPSRDSSTKKTQPGLDTPSRDSSTKKTQPEKRKAEGEVEKKGTTENNKNTKKKTDHETRMVGNMMGQFMAMMGQVMGQTFQQGSSQYPPLDSGGQAWSSFMPHSTGPSGSQYTNTYGGQSAASPMSYHPGPYPSTAGGQSWGLSMSHSAASSGNLYTSTHGRQSQGPSMSYDNPAPSMPHCSTPPVSEDTPTSDEPTYTQL
ncbi:hypothetical protein Bbelb_316130 [Branchiostoma belcheri]|nr:hypothetical protein Bbelb_316130 [Branchiostoma belcheri]